MPKEFRYDVIKLIRCVRDRPCLWDKSLESYKDRVERRSAWEEVFNILDERYEDMSQPEKKQTGEHILNKWTNIRDTFVKTLKTRCGKKHKRKYILHNQLEFLVKVVAEHTGGSDVDYNTECTEDPIILNTTTLKHEKDIEKESSPVLYNSRKRTKKAESEDEIKDSPKQTVKEYDKNELDFVEVEESSDPRIMNEDEAFFASLLPSVVRYTEDERLEFRIEVLALMRRIKDNRKWARNS